MNRTYVEFKAREIVAAYESNDYESLSRYVSNAANELKSVYQKKDYPDMQVLLEKLDYCFAYSIKEEETKESIGYLVGYLSGILKAIEELMISDDFKLDTLIKEERSAEIEAIPHVNKILKLLCTIDEVQHKKLADYIGIDKSTLTPIMEKLDKLNLVKFSRIGKFKYYYITSLGRAYNEKLVSKEDKLADNEGKLEQILELLLKDREKKQKSEKKRKEIEGTNPIGSFESKKALNIYFLKNHSNRNMIRFVETDGFDDANKYIYSFIQKELDEQGRRRSERTQKNSSIDMFKPA